VKFNVGDKVRVLSKSPPYLEGVVVMVAAARDDQHPYLVSVGWAAFSCRADQLQELDK
jgi:hypothetical protein